MQNRMHNMTSGSSLLQFFRYWHSQQWYGDTRVTTIASYILPGKIADGFVSERKLLT